MQRSLTDGEAFATVAVRLLSSRLVVDEDRLAVALDEAFEDITSAVAARRVERVSRTVAVVGRADPDDVDLIAAVIAEEVAGAGGAVAGFLEIRRALEPLAALDASS